MKTSLIIISLFFLGCVNKSTIISNESIEVYYMRPYVSTSFSYPCGMISKAALKDDIHFKEFKDSTTINKFIKIYNNYEIEPNPDDRLDARIKVIINTKK
jgi:hypothetical protein